MKLIFILIINLTMFSFACSQDAPDLTEITHRPPTVAGAFYPGDPEKLAADVDKYLDTVAPRELREDIDIFGLVAPHAGYVYSGMIAGRAYREVRGRKYDAVVVIAPSHQKAFTGASVFNGEAYSTPLGIVKVDIDLAIRIAKVNSTVNLSLNGHEWNMGRGEHSLEVQLPFIQRALPDVPLVPIVMGSQDFQTNDALVKALVSGIRDSKKKVLLVASTDLSHFHSLAEARKIDLPLVKAFERYDYFKMAYKLATRDFEACGGSPVVVVMTVAEMLGANMSMPLLYSTSANSLEAEANEDRVVGYFSGVLINKKDKDPFGLPQLTEDEKQQLLKSAMTGIEDAVTNNQSPAMRYIPRTLSQEFAAFVTIKKKGQLRGCMGHTFASKSLMMEVEEAGRLASTKDSRFGPLKKKELKEIEVEVTVLSRYKRILDYNEVNPGTDGVYLRLGNYSGLFLPQVASENNWDRKTYLEQLGYKAGLDKDAYKNPDAELYIFRAIKIN